MYQTYKPSGKISFLFFPFGILVLCLFIPAASFLLGLVMWYIPSLIFNALLFGVCVYLIAMHCTIWCIKSGKVRNKGIATLFGMLLGAAFLFFLFVFFYSLDTGPVETVTFFSWDIPKAYVPTEGIISLLTNPQDIPEAWNAFAQKGFTYLSDTGSPVFSITGTFFNVIWGIAAFIVIGLFAASAWYDSIQPFCESSKKWAREVAFPLQYLADRDAFLKKAAFGDYSALWKLDSLYDVNSDYSIFKLYVTEGNSDFYVTITNRKRDAGPRGKDGEVSYTDEDVVSLYRIDRQTGEMLLTKSRSENDTVTARVVTKSQIRKRLVRMVFHSIVQVAMIAYCFLQMDATNVFFTSGMFFFYLVISFVVSFLGFILSFVKEEVMIQDEDTDTFDDTKHYQVEKRGDPPGYKIYHFCIAATSVAMFIYCIIIGA